MDKTKAVGSLLFIVCVIVALLWIWAVWLSPYYGIPVLGWGGKGAAVKLFGLTAVEWVVGLGFLVMLVIFAWIGWTMATMTTEIPEELEEKEKEKKE